MANNPTNMPGMAELIERVRKEGSYTRNSKDNSLKTVKQAVLAQTNVLSNSFSMLNTMIIDQTTEIVSAISGMTVDLGDKFEKPKNENNDPASKEEKREQNKFFEGISKGFDGLVKGVQNIEKGISNLLDQGAKAALGLGLLTLFFDPMTVIDAIVEIRDFFTGAFDSINQALAGDLEPAMQFMKDNVILTSLSALWVVSKFAFVSTLLLNVGKFIGSLGFRVFQFGSLIFSIGKFFFMRILPALWGAVASLATTLYTGVIALWGGFKSMAATLFRTIIPAIWAGITTLSASLLAGITSLISGLMGIVTTTIAPAIVAMAPFVAIGALLALTLGALVKSVQDAYDTFKETGSIGEALKSLFSKFTGYFLGWPINLLKEVSVYFLDMFGFDKLAAELDAMDPVGAISDMMSDVIDYFSQLADDVIFYVRKKAPSWLGGLTDEEIEAEEARRAAAEQTRIAKKAEREAAKAAAEQDRLNSAEATRLEQIAIENEAARLEQEKHQKAIDEQNRLRQKAEQESAELKAFEAEMEAKGYKMGADGFTYEDPNASSIADKMAAIEQSMARNSLEEDSVRAKIAAANDAAQADYKAAIEAENRMGIPKIESPMIGKSADDLMMEYLGGNSALRDNQAENNDLSGTGILGAILMNRGGDTISNSSVSAPTIQMTTTPSNDNDDYFREQSTFANGIL